MTARPSVLDKWCGREILESDGVPAGVQLGGAVQHSNDVDLAAVGVGERIAVIGGGQTAGQLALRAASAQRPAVTLISRGPRRVADLDVGRGLADEDHLAPFRATLDPEERRRVCRASAMWLNDE